VERVSLNPVLEHRNERGPQVLVEHLGEIGARVLSDVRLDLRSRDPLMPKGLIQAAQVAAPLLVVAPDLTDRVHQAATLQVAID